MSLFDLGKWRDTLAATDALTPVVVSMDGTAGITQFSLPSGWNVGLEGKEPQEVTEASLGTGTADNLTQFRLTKQAALDVCHSVGLSPKYVARTPGPLIQSHLNYWATHSPDTNLRLLVKDQDALVMAKEGIVSFSNLELLDRALDAMAEFGPEGQDVDQYVLVDSRSHHSLDLTVTRLVNTFKAYKHGGKEWMPGVQITNSLVGSTPLSVQGYWYNDTEDSGVVSLFTEGRYNRKTQGQDFGEVMDWVEQAARNVCEETEQDMECLDNAHAESVAGSMSPVLADIFKQYKVPLKARQPIMDMLIESEDFTYFGIVESISKSATYEGLPPHFVSTLMEIAGDIAKHTDDRCDACKRTFA